MKDLLENIQNFFIPDNLDKEHIGQAKLLSIFSPLIGVLSLAIFLFPKEPDEILVAFGLLGSSLLIILPLIIKFSGNYKISSAVFTSVSLALFPLCLFEYGGLLSPVLVWLPLMPLLLSYLLGWKEGMSIAGLLSIELIALAFVNAGSSQVNAEQLDQIYIHTLSSLLAIGAGVLLSLKLENKKKNRESKLSDTQSSLQEALRAKELFWNNISHEIRTPLNGILGMTQVLLEAKITNEQEELLKIIKDSGIHLKAVLNDVVDYSQLELGDLKLKKEPFKVEESLNKIVYLFKDYLQERDVQLSYEVHEHFPSALLTDSYRIRQILIHLTSNALKFTHSGFVKIRAEISEEENVFLFSVTDSGKGIKKQAQSKIFTTFYQGDVSATREYGGAGLGLALCKRLIELMGGNINFESDEGKGSHFYFTVKAMPLDITHQISQSDEILTPAITEFNLKQSAKKELDASSTNLKDKGLSILIVEDNPVNLTLMETLLKQLGHNVLLAKNGLEALSVMERSDFDIIFMDIQMPLMDGIECTKQIFKIYGEDRPAIVAVTANVHQREECKELGMDDFIGKPINTNKIKMTLNKLMSTHRSYIELPKEPASNEAQRFSASIETCIFDSDAFATNFGNDEEIMSFLVEQFKQSAPRLLSDINTAISNENAKALEASSHSLKGALSNFFCADLRELAVQLENCGKKNNFKKAFGLYFELKTQVEELQIELDTCFENKKAAS